MAKTAGAARTFSNDPGADGESGRAIENSRCGGGVGGGSGAAGRVQEHYGFALPVSAGRAAPLEQAQRAREKLADKYQASFRALPLVGARHVLAQTDGTLVCTIASGKRKAKKPRGWKEIRRAAGQEQIIYAATLGNGSEVGRRWGHGARDAGWGLNSQIHALGDGAEWIRLQTNAVFGRQGTFLCDFFHVSEDLGHAAPSCRGPAPQRWRRTPQGRLKRGAFAQVIQDLAKQLEPAGTPEEEAPVSNAHRYLNNRTDGIDYPRALKLGWPMGSGMMESGHRHVLPARLKKAGAAWLMESAAKIANLRVPRANHLWTTLWN